MTPELSNTLAQLAQKLGTTAERLWPVLVAQARIEAYVHAGLWLLAISSAVFCAVRVKRSFSDEYDPDSRMGWLLALCATGVVALAYLFQAPTLIGNVACPEAAALARLMGK